jgi:hypothetical protein
LGFANFSKTSTNMRAIFFAVLIVGSFSASFGQGAYNSNAGGTVVNDYAKPPVFLHELFRDGQTPKLYADINGSPFLFDNFLLSRIHFMDGRHADSILIKLNIYDNKVNFINENLEEMQISIPIKQIEIIDSRNPTWFGNIYRTNLQMGGPSFFQIIADGPKAQLLKKVMVKVWETRSLGDQQKKNFQYEDELYLATDNTVFVAGKKCGAFVNALVEKYHEPVNQFVTTNNLRCNKEDEMKKLVEYCNRLQ